MSIHAELAPEAKARLAAQRRNSTITSAIIAFLVIVVVGMVLGLFLLPNMLKESPTIVTYQSNEIREEKPNQEKLRITIQRKPTPPSSAMAKVIAATTVSNVSIPVPDMVVDVQSVDFGDGDDFGGGWGDGLEFGKGGGGASFFNQSVKADRIAYVIDFSSSMKSNAKHELLRDELAKSVGGIKDDTLYQMVFFAGSGWVAGSPVTGGKVKGGKDSQKPEWLKMTSSERDKSIAIIRNTGLVGGTKWEGPLEMAFAMEPPPQIIFFMTDGRVAGDMMAIAGSLASKAKGKGIIINSIAMMEPRAEEPMFKLANETGGQFTIIEKDGKARLVKKLKK